MYATLLGGQPRLAFETFSNKRRASRQSSTLKTAARGKARNGNADSKSFKPCHCVPKRQAESHSGVFITLLLGDIGGTNARFELRRVDLKTGLAAPQANECIKFYNTNDHPTFQSALRLFFCDTGINASEVASGCLACAGPVVQNKCTMTNLDWVVDGQEVESEFGFRTAVLNDFVAVGYAIPTLGAADVKTINDQPFEEQGPIAVLGPGTGLGQVQLLWDTGVKGYTAWASEGSHAGFAPRGALQRELLEFAETELEMPCEVEHVACGAGLKRIYRFLCAKYGTRDENLAPSQISDKALANACSTCSQAVDLLVEIIGAEAGAMALRCLATGGVFISGGIPAKILNRLTNGNLEQSFINPRSRFSTVMTRFPLHVVTAEIGLRGTLQYAKAIAQGRR